MTEKIDKKDSFMRNWVQPIILGLLFGAASGYLSFEIRFAEIKIQMDTAGKDRVKITESLKSLEKGVKANSATDNSIKVELEKMRGEQRVTNERLKSLDEKVTLLLEKRRKR